MLRHGTSGRTGSGSTPAWVKPGYVGLMWAGIGLLYVGLDFPGARKAGRVLQDAIEQPKKTTQMLSIGAGSLMLLAAKK